MFDVLLWYCFLELKSTLHKRDELLLLGFRYRQGLDKLSVVAHAEPGAHPGTVDNFVFTEMFAIGIQANVNFRVCHAPAGRHGIPHLV